MVNAVAVQANRPLEDAHYVVARARGVAIDHRSLNRLSAQVATRGIIRIHEPEDSFFYDGTYRTLHFLLVFHALDFGLGPHPGRPSLSGVRADEDLALALSLKRAFEDGTPLWSARYLSRLPALELACILGGTGDPPMLAERVALVNQIGQRLQERHGGQVKRIVRNAESSAPRLAALLGDEFPAFRDEAAYDGRTVQFLARAQAFVTDLHRCFGGTRWGNLTGLGLLTARADHRLAQALRTGGGLSLDPRLARHLDGGGELPPGSAEEVELRACSAWAVHLIHADLAASGVPATADDVRRCLLALLPATHAVPFHRTNTTAYRS